MRVLHLSATLDPSKGSGPADALRFLTREQARLGMRVTVMTTDAPGVAAPQVAMLSSAGVTVIQTGPAPGPSAGGRTSDEALKHQFREGVDVVHIHGMWGYFNRV